MQWGARRWICPAVAVGTLLQVKKKLPVPDVFSKLPKYIVQLQGWCCCLTRFEPSALFLDMNWALETFLSLLVPKCLLRGRVLVAGSSPQAEVFFQLQLAVVAGVLVWKLLWPREVRSFSRFIAACSASRV